MAMAIFLLVFISIPIIVHILVKKSNMAKKKKISDEFLQQHPNAIKLYIYSQSEEQKVSVPKVNNELPVCFYEEDKEGIYLLPCENHTLNLLYEEKIKSSQTKITTAIMKIMPQENTSYELRFENDVEKFKSTYSTK